ncbi:MAG TPA: hypothetical protein VMR21_04295 [Vicinamibacteria bacterium]|nr:hypothetical protein [Vicinamibacteria bacterium]
MRKAFPARRVAAAVALLVLFALAPARSQDRGPVVTSLTLFAGASSGLWRSTNWGGRWERVLGRSQGASLAEVGAVYGVLPLGRKVFAATQAGLFLSDDFGETWKKMGLDVPVLSVLPSRYPQADPTVFAGTADGLLKSTDGGLTFAPTVLRGTPVTHMEWPGPALVVATGHGVLVSTDGAQSFGSGMGLPNGPPAALAVSSFFIVDPVLFTAVGDAGVFRSADGARTWAPAGLEGKTVRDLVWLGPILYAATTEGLFRSDDAGKRWTAASGLAAQPARQLIFPLAPDSGLEAFLATDAGVLHTPDGGAHWKTTGALDDTVLCLATFPPPDPGPMRKSG